MYSFQKNILNIYQNNLDHILDEIKSKKGPLLKLMNVERKKCIQKIKNTYKNNIHSYLINKNIIGFINFKSNKQSILQITPTLFKKYKDITLPFVNDDIIFKEELEKNPADLILESGFFTPQELKDIENILSISRLDSSSRFRTIKEKDKLMIEGSNLPTIYCLAGLAHELGHCLYEKNINRSAFLAPYYSEVIAHIIEEKLVSSILQRKNIHLKNSWTNYQRNIDKLNIFFYIYEWKDIISNACLEANFRGKGVFLRESLFVLPGFQSVYAYASIKRIELLKHEYKLDELIRMFSNVE